MEMLAQMGWGLWFLAVLIIFVCVFLMIVILLQRGRGGGLAGAFGGAGGSSAFGAKTGDVFTWITVVTAGVFVFLAVLGNYAFDQSPRPPSPAPATAVPVTPPPPGGSEALPIKIAPVEGGPGKGGDAAGSDTGTVVPTRVPPPLPVTPAGKTATEGGERTDTPPSEEGVSNADTAGEGGPASDLKEPVEKNPTKAPATPPEGGDREQPSP